MAGNDDIYRQLQKHLDRQPVGFPRTWSGADIRLLKRLFAPDQARLAQALTYRPASLSLVLQRLPPGQSPEQVEQLLNGMFMKGVIGRKERGGERVWYLMPLIVGMFEAQLGNMTRRLVADSAAYMRTLSFGRSFLAVQPSQMRTIPVNISIPVEQSVATYDDVRGLVAGLGGPFVVLPCICRKLKAMKRQPCRQTSREESCLAFGETAAMCLQRGMGREVTRDETLAILERNEGDGLVLQPSNTQRAEFLCSCCGCCCGMLGVQKMLPRPVDFWTSNFYAELDGPACRACGTCVERCQVGAVSPAGPGEAAVVNLDRCIGCGLCVPTCPAGALRLVRKERETVPPVDEEALHEAIRANRKGLLGELATLLKVALRVRPRGARGGGAGKRQ
jgi:Pyruvate/2-oxoacid:ferredoxin oxidoreductase delta subunit